MDPLTASALITGGSTILGGIMGSKAAKQDRAATAEANRMRMMPYLDARGYVTDMYKRGQGALDSALDAGYYQGPTFAPLDPLQNQGIQSIAGVGGQSNAGCQPVYGCWAVALGQLFRYLQSCQR